MPVTICDYPDNLMARSVKITLFRLGGELSTAAEAISCLVLLIIREDVCAPISVIERHPSLKHPFSGQIDHSDKVWGLLSPNQPQQSLDSLAVLVNALLVHCF